MKTKTLFFLVCHFFMFPLFAQGEGSNFTMWQLPTLHDYIGNAYVFQMDNGKIAVMDGGMDVDDHYLKGFLGALGNEVEAWFISHPHGDHVGALNEILRNPGFLKIKTIYHSELPEGYYKHSRRSDSIISAYYERLNNSGAEVINLTEPGTVIKIDETQFKILTVANPNLKHKIINNASMVIRVWDEDKSMLFLGDLEEEGGDSLLNSQYRNELDCDYIQLSHHGQQGVKMDFYRSVSFTACFWPTPTWLYSNDIGDGFNTGPYKTIETRELIDSLGVEQYFNTGGLVRID
ncbi:MAG: MBL fold metallo-hydrolase [Bacteroidota bacterium]